MSGNVTLANAVSRVRTLANIVDSTFWTDAEIQTELESGLGELYDIIVESNGDDYFLTTTEAHDTVAGTDTYDVYQTVGDMTPAAIYKVLQVEVKLSDGVWRRSRPISYYEESDRNQDTSGWTSHEKVFYRLYISSTDGPLVSSGWNYKIRFSPTPQGVHQFRIRYLPIPSDWSTGSLVYPSMSGWDDFCVFTAAARVAVSEESFEQAQFFVGERDRAEGRVRRQSRTFNLDDRERVRDANTQHSGDRYHDHLSGHGRRY